MTATPTMKSVSTMTKKERKAYYNAQRGSWYGLNPVTRKPRNSRAYDRNRTRSDLRQSRSKID